MKLEEETKECTFQPQQKEIKDEVDFGEFLDGQDEHKKRMKLFRESKEKEKEQEELKKLRDRPEINKEYASKRAKEGEDQKVHERLAKKRAKMDDNLSPEQKAKVIKLFIIFF